MEHGCILGLRCLFTTTCCGQISIRLLLLLEIAPLNNLQVFVQSLLIDLRFAHMDTILDILPPLVQCCLES